MASQAGRLPAHHADLLGRLLDVPHWGSEAGRAVLKPLWAEEAMHRAYWMVRLLARQAERDTRRRKDDLTIGVERALAESLADAYRTVVSGGEDDIVPCSGLLRDVALNLGALFGSDGVAISTDVARVSLPAYKRRALVLCVSELTINALVHAFDPASSRGRVDVSLRVLDRDRACLRVADNGTGFRCGKPDPARSVAGGLAGLIEADLVYYGTWGWTTTAELIFPIGGGACARRQ
jgi:signal transduction histidine kinase